MNNIPIHYSIPSRQVVLAIGGCFAMVAAIGGMAMWVDTGSLAAVIALVFIGIYLWSLIRFINAVGEISIKGTSLFIVPLRSSICAPSGPITINSDDIDRVQVGSTIAPNNPRLYVTIQTRRPGRRSLILNILRPEDSGLAAAIVALANEARLRDGGAPIQAENPYDSRGWRFASISLLVLFAAAVVATLAAGKADDLSVWARVITLGAFSIPLYRQVFPAKPK